MNITKFTMIENNFPSFGDKGLEALDVKRNKPRTALFQVVMAVTSLIRNEMKSKGCWLALECSAPGVQGGIYQDNLHGEDGTACQTSL